MFAVAEDKMHVVEKNVKKKNLNVWYEATQVSAEKSKKVYCYISPRVSSEGGREGHEI